MKKKIIYKQSLINEENVLINNLMTWNFRSKKIAKIRTKFL